MVESQAGHTNAYPLPEESWGRVGTTGNWNQNKPYPPYHAEGAFYFPEEVNRLRFPQVKLWKLMMLFDNYDPETNLLNGLSAHREIAGYKVPDLRSQDHRWLAVSALQKSVRQGNVREALKAAYVLKSLSEGHLWNRLKVIALEDVGLADPDIVAQVLWVAGKREWRKRCRGCDYILNYILHRLCISRKCRSLDDALYIADRHPLYAEQRLAYSGMDEQELCGLFFDKRLDVIERVIVCWFLAGTKRYPATNLEIRKGHPELIYDLALNMGAPPHIFDLLKLGKSQEYFVCLLPCLIQLQQSAQCSVTQECQNPAPLIGHWPAPAYDRHTRIGKWAFRRFLKSCPAVSGFLARHLPEADPVDLVGWAVFILEGQLLNERMIFDDSERLRDMAAQAWLHSGGMEISMQTDFLSLMRDNEKGLKNARKYVAEK